jgi:manganese transport protein
MATILAFGVVITLIFQSSPVSLIIIAQSLTMLVAPILDILLLIMSNRRNLMGELRNRWWHNVFGTIGLIAILAISLRLITTLVS